MFLNAKLEMDLMDMEPTRTPRSCFSRSAPRSPGSTSWRGSGFHTLGLQTYLTAGPKESRAWTIRKGWTAPQAAGVIHTDFQRGFIKAEVVSFDDLDAAGSMAAAGPPGKVRIEGKDYVMQRRRRRGVPTLCNHSLSGSAPQIWHCPPAPGLASHAHIGM